MSNEELLRSLLEALQKWQSVAKMAWLYKLGHEDSPVSNLTPQELGGPRWLVEAHDGNEELIESGIVNEADLRDRQRQRSAPVELARQALALFDKDGERCASILESLRVDSSPLLDFIRQEQHRSASTDLAAAAERAVHQALIRQNAGAGAPAATPPHPQQNEGDSAQFRLQVLAKLKPAARRAYLSFEAICTKIEKSPDQVRDREVYDILKEEGIPEDADGLADYRLPAFGTWTRYLREARQELGDQKYTPRRGRDHGNSIVRQDQIEQRKKDDRSAQ